MQSLFDTFIHKKPRCFGAFLLKNQSTNNYQLESAAFLTAQVQCPCGCELLNVYASYNKEMILAPAILECPGCSTSAVIFSPDQHGWDGEQGNNCSLIGQAKPRLVNLEPTKVCVEYSYQGVENYRDLVADGVANPEDYFETFNLYRQDNEGTQTEIFGYECA